MNICGAQCYVAGMTAFLSARGTRIFDYPRFAEPLRDAIRERAQELAEPAGIEIEHISKAQIRKEEVVAKVLKRRGDNPGLVHVISAMEACSMGERISDNRNRFRSWNGKHQANWSTSISKTRAISGAQP